MNLRSLFYFVFILALLGSCNDKSSEATIVAEDETRNEQGMGDEGSAVPATQESSTVTSTAAPEYMNIELEGFGTPNANLKDFHGEVIFLNHWGSWCPPCRMEMPSIQELYNDYGEKVKFVMIATEKKKGAHVPYIEKEGFTFPVYSALSPISTEMKARAFPTTIIIDKTGKVRINDVGAADWNAPSVRQLLDGLLAE